MQRNSIFPRSFVSAVIVVSAVISLACWNPASSHGAELEPFPIGDLLPKDEIGVLRFLEQHPTWDGRGVVVAVFDTGVDPGAPGLRITSDGRPKVIDVIDGTGCGDVLMQRAVEPDGTTIAGVSGRNLRLNAAWLAPGREFRLGIKRAYDFFPPSLVSRLKAKRRTIFERHQQVIEEGLRRQLLNKASDASTLDQHEKPGPDELSARLAQLQVAAQRYDDPGPVFDCVVFHDGDRWRAVVDTDEDGDLTDEKLLTDFHAERQFGTFGADADLNFAVNIYEHGRRLSLVADSGAHGTHVAGIIGGYFPDEPERNGLAPGVQIVSVKIGDLRLNNMESGLAIARGIQAAVRNQCDLINMSYGEPTQAPDRGFLTSEIAKLVDDHGVVFVAAAGNDGPALSTVIAPGGTTGAVLGVGAFVSPQTARAAYALPNGQQPLPFTWSSRGPTFDGDLGVAILAPGGAVSPVPAWTERRRQRMNGTSMAAPSASGAVALLISAMKASGRHFSPAAIRRALKNTAQPVDGADPWTQGAGLMQVDRAMDWLKTAPAADLCQPRLSVNIPQRNGARGLYLREHFETRRRSEHTIVVTPVFPRESTAAEKSNFERRIVLRSTAPWCSSGDFARLDSRGSEFKVAVDPARISPGPHFAEIIGLDSEHPELGPLFRVPVTVIVPQRQAESPEESDLVEQIQLAPGAIARRFFAVPATASVVDLELQRLDDGPPQGLMLHCLQVVPGANFREASLKQRITLAPGQRFSKPLAVHGGQTLELCLAQDWSAGDNVTLAYKLRFGGVAIDQPTIDFSVNRDVKRVQASAGRTPQLISVEAQLTHRQRLVTPAKARIVPLDPERDLLADGRAIYGLELTYKFRNEQLRTHVIGFEADDERLYESPLAGRQWSLRNAVNQLVATGDFRRRELKLNKGDFTLELRLFHSAPKILERYRSLRLVLETPLDQPVAVRAYPSPTAAAHAEGEIRETTLDAGERRHLFLARPPERELRAVAQSGEVLVGRVSLLKPASLPLTVVVPEPVSQDSDPVAQPSSETLADEIRDLKIRRLEQLAAAGNQKPFIQRLEELLDEYPGHLPLRVAKLHFLDEDSRRKQHLHRVVQAADDVLTQIDHRQLALYFGRRPRLETAKAKANDERFRQLRETLIETLYRKGRALGYMELPDVIAKHPIDDPAAHDAAFEANFAELARWVDTTDPQYFLLHIRRDRRQGRYGAALALLNKYIETAEPDYWYYKKRRDFYGLLGWDHLESLESKWLLFRFPDRGP